MYSIRSFQTGDRDCSYHFTDNVLDLFAGSTLSCGLENLRWTQHDAPCIYVCLLQWSCYLLGYSSLDWDFAVGCWDSGGVVCDQGCVEWRERMWEYGVVVGEWVGAGAAVDVFRVIYGGFEGERGTRGRRNSKPFVAIWEFGHGGKRLMQRNGSS